MKRGLAVSAALAGGLGAWAAVRYRNWRRGEEIRLSRGALQRTAAGPVEYASRGEGPVVLVSHGALGGYDQGLAIAQLIGIRGIRFIAVSRPGYLGTPLASGRTFERQAHAFAALLDELAVPEAAVLGISAGGPPALEFARAFPGRCAGLILLSAVTRRLHRPDVKVPPAMILAASPLGDFGGWLLRELMHGCPLAASRWMLRPYELEMLRDPGRRAAFLSVVDTFVPLSPRREGMLNDAAQLERYPDAPPEGIGCPALIVHGSADEVVPFRHAASAAAAIPGAELVPLPDGGHLAGIFQSHEVRARMAGFLAERFDLARSG